MKTMDFAKLANQYIKDGAWDGAPAVAVRHFAKWLEEHVAAQQMRAVDEGDSPAPETIFTLEGNTGKRTLLK